MSRINVKPLHEDLQSVVSTSTHTSLKSSYTNNNKAYGISTSSRSNSTHTSLISSNYQYLNVIATNASEPINLLDSTIIGYTILISEPINLVDFIYTGRAYIEEPINLLDSTAINYVLQITETMPMLDEAGGSRAVAWEDDLSLRDSTQINITVAISELFNLYENINPFQSIDIIDSTQISVCAPADQVDSTSMAISTTMNVTDSTYIQTVPFSVLPVTNASSVDNPFIPTIIIGGVIYTYNAGTAPP